MKTKVILNSIYLQIIFSLSLFLILIYDINAAEKVMVTKPRTVIYADPELHVPIGRLSRGTPITIGSKLRRSGRVATVIVSGRVAYIEVKNLRRLNQAKFNSDAEVNNDVEVPQQSDEEHLKELSPPTLEYNYSKKRINLNYHYFVPQISQSDLGNDSYNGQQIIGEFELWPWQKFGLKAGGFLQSINGANNSLSFWGGEIGMLYQLMDPNEIPLVLFGSFIYAPIVNLNSPNSSYQSSLLGGVGGIQTEFQFSSKWILVLSLGLRWIQTSNFEVKASSNGNATGINSVQIMAPDICLGISYSL